MWNKKTNKQLGRLNNWSTLLSTDKCDILVKCYFFISWQYSTHSKYCRTKFLSLHWSSKYILYCCFVVSQVSSFLSKSIHTQINFWWWRLSEGLDFCILSLRVYQPHHNIAYCIPQIKVVMMMKIMMNCLTATIIIQ